MQAISQGVIFLLKFIRCKNICSLNSLMLSQRRFIRQILFFNYLEVYFLKKVYDPYDAVFEEIYHKNYLYLVKYLTMLVRDIDIAEDLTHDIFIRIYNSKNIEITGSKFRNYIKKAAKNIAIDHLRKIAREEARNKKIFPELKELDDLFYSSLENCVIEGEVISTVNDVLEGFAEKNRKIFISRIMENKSRKQVSDEEKVTSYSVKVIEDEIIHKLREKLKQYF